MSISLEERRWGRGGGNMSKTMIYVFENLIKNMLTEKILK